MSQESLKILQWNEVLQTSLVCRESDSDVSFLCDVLGHGMQDQDLALWFVALDPGIGSMVLATVSCW